MNSKLPSEHPILETTESQITVINPAETPVSTASTGNAGPAVDEEIRNLPSLAAYAMGISFFLALLQVLILALIRPALIPWSFLTTIFVLSNAWTWGLMIRGGLKIDGASRAQFFQGLTLKISILSGGIFLLFLLQPLTQGQRLAVLAGLLTPVVGVVMAAMVPQTMQSQPGAKKRA
jgi:hypothetical protein